MFCSVFWGVVVVVVVVVVVCFVVVVVVLGGGGVFVILLLMLVVLVFNLVRWSVLLSCQDTIYNYCPLNLEVFNRHDINKLSNVIFLPD